MTMLAPDENRISPIYLKLGGIALITIALLIPQAMIESMVQEREQRHAGTVRSVLEEWGDELEVRGPALAVTCDGVTRYAVAKKLEVGGALEAGTRARGIYRVNVYQGTMTLAGVIDVKGAGTALVPPNAATPCASKLIVFLSRFKALTGAASLETSSSGFRPMTAAIELEGKALPHIAAELPLSAVDEGGSLKFNVKLPLRGARRLTVAPLAELTHARLAADWASPSFTGAWLPVKHERSEGGGFIAEWSGASPFGSLASANNDALASLLAASGFGVELLDQVSHYLQVTRAIKYAILFVALTFLTFFLFEVLGGLKLHPVQYLSVGSALCLFYMLLLSLSEEIAFWGAYLIAASATVALVTGYARAILKARGRAFAVGGGLAALYGYLFFLLSAERFSLISGAFGLFALLAAFMYLTRNIDWYRVGKGGAEVANPATQLSP